MVFEFTDTTGGSLQLIEIDPNFYHNAWEHVPEYSTHTIAINYKAAQNVFIDEIAYNFRTKCILPLMMNQTFRFERAEDIIFVRFNREFYCIGTHDAEVGCAGHLFFGPNPAMFILPDDFELEKIKQLYAEMKAEISQPDTTQAAMLRLLLAQFIVSLTRLSKKQYLPAETSTEQYDLLRQFSLLVEGYYRQEKQVKFYAARLHKSPKTLANLFAKYSKKSPLAIIHDRVITEAKRLIYYTDKSVKEIAVELGFEDSSHFNKFVKAYTSLTPTQLKKEKNNTSPGNSTSIDSI
jgi:AraC family transcriptional regulator, transcriptional activator of pobA